MTYNEFIQNIINIRGQWNNLLRSTYCERHHIIPHCLGGLPKKTSWAHHKNIIWLTAKEHFIAHKLLALENPTNYKLVSAWRKMWITDETTQQRYEPTPEEYEQMRLLFSQTQSVVSLEMWKDPQFRKKQEWTTERRKKLSKSSIGKTVSIETRKKQSVARKGKPSKKRGCKVSEETRLKISAGVAGNKNGMYNKHHSEETKEKIRQANLGKEVYWWNNGNINTMAKTCPGDGWIRGRIPGFKHKNNKNYKNKRKGISTKNYLFKLPDGSTKIADLGNTRRWHKDWVLIKKI